MSSRDSTQSRVGHLRLSEDYSQLLAATLDDVDGGGVRLRIPYLVGAAPERWFWSSLGQYVGASGQILQPEKPPTELNYFDHKGTLGLVGCRSGGGGSVRWGGYSAASGVGSITADYAVEKAFDAANYVKINGFRSEIDGLAQWLGYYGHRTSTLFAEDGKDTVITTRTDLQPDLNLARRLKLRATLTVTAPTTQQAEAKYVSTAQLQTYSVTAKDWKEHVVAHRAIRDLIRVACWKPVTFRAHEATSDAERQVVRVGDDPQSRWCPVSTALTGIGEPVWSDRERPLFVFQEIGFAGVERWLRLAETYRRGLRPLLRVLDIRDGTIDEHMAQIGIAFEAVGYQSFLESGSSEKGADKKSMAQHVRKIATEVSACVPVAIAFPQEFADAYNGVKHANREEPDPVELLARYRLGVKVLRAWIALRLGTPPDKVRDRLA